MECCHPVDANREPTITPTVVAAEMPKRRPSIIRNSRFRFISAIAPPYVAATSRYAGGGVERTAGGVMGSGVEAMPARQQEAATARCERARRYALYAKC